MSDARGSSPWGEPARPYRGSAGSGERPATGRSSRPRYSGTVGVRVTELREAAWRKWWVKGRATTGLIIIALALGLALAAALGGLVWAIATAIHHAASQ